jgi:glycosyltransferase involved in cell wall biosynthesis
MTAATPSVSVVIPAREREPYLEEAIRSAIGEGPDEVLVVTPEGGRSARVAGPLGARLVDSEGVGSEPQPRRNLGAREARAGVVAFLDADDRFPAGRMAPMLAALGDAVTGLVQAFVSPDRTEAVTGRIKVDLAPRVGVVCGAMLVRRESFLSLGGLREDLLTGEVPDWISRAEDAGLVVAGIDRVVLERRLHGDGHLYGTRGSEMRADYLRLARERILRSRGS